MRKLIDWFLLSSDEYCEKYGHKWNEVKRTYYEDGGRWAVAYRTTYKVDVCSRCNKKENEEQVSKKHIDSLKMSSEKWDELEEKGKVRIS